MTDTQAQKAALRGALRQRRKALSRTEQDAAAHALINSVLQLPHWQQARHIALYLASDGEIDTAGLITIAQDQGKQLYLPVVGSDKSLCFAHWDSSEPLIPNRYNIPEPPDTAQQCPASELDIVLLPLVGWDAQGGRLGMGGGYYDRALSGVKGPLLVGLAHEGQQVDQIPHAHWDIRLDYIATDSALYMCKK